MQQYQFPVGPIICAAQHEKSVHYLIYKYLNRNESARIPRGEAHQNHVRDIISCTISRRLEGLHRFGGVP